MEKRDKKQEKYTPIEKGIENAPGSVELSSDLSLSDNS